MSDTSTTAVIDATRCWIEQVVLKFNLCPFAHKPFQSKRIRYAVSEAREPESLLRDLIEELERLRRGTALELETTLLIHPYVLLDFLDYNDFLAVVDAVLDEGGYTGEFQVASLHPQYRFNGTAVEDAENYTNRSPYPMLHLLREESVERVLESYPDADTIPAHNIEKMNDLGTKTLRRILYQCLQSGKEDG
ncbi:MAG: DUF1415 domain-containing protein [Gammaproteobacteria bacterium]|nr:DUF1415 domain-containing protein [Gammaproteobacteria bacterium]